MSIISLPEHDSRQAQAFMRSLLTDVSALERMIEAGRIERRAAHWR